MRKSMVNIRGTRRSLVVLGLVVLTTASACGSSGTKNTSSGSTGGATPTTSQSEGQAGGSTIVLGDVGSYSGPIGSQNASIPTILQNWVAETNAAGGINGHPVKILVDDDAGNTTKSVSEIQTLVEVNHVIAFTANNYPVTSQAGAPYLLSKQIPVVGGDDTEATWFDNPMFFSQGSSPTVQSQGIADLAKANGVTKIGVWQCNLGAPCDSAEAITEEAFTKDGIQVVNHQTIGLTQANYEANCLEAKSAGDTAIQAEGPASPTFINIINSCSRIGYHPVYYTVGPQASNVLLDAPGVVDYFTQPWFPWFLRSGSPELDAWATATQGLSPSSLGQPQAGTWVSLELLKAVLEAGVPRGGTPTTQEVLNGLYSIQNDSLGGIAIPLRYQKGQPTPVVDCWFIGELSGGKFSTPDGTSAHCASSSS